MRIEQIAVLLVSIFYVGIAVGSDGTTTTFTGTARLRYEDSFAKDPISADRVGFTSLRMRPNLQVVANPDINLVFEPQFAKTLGAQALLPSSSSTNVATDTSGNSSYSNDALTVFQAYMELKFCENYSFTGGRQVLKYGDELILGQSDWGLYGRSFDALKFRYSTPSKTVDFFNAKIVENTNTSSRAGGDKDLYGLYASWNFSEALKTLDAYYFYLYDARDPALATPADSGRPAFFATFGTRWVVLIDKITWKFEIAQNSGAEGTAYVTANENSKNNMLDTDVSYSLDETNKKKVSFQIFRADVNWRDLYPTTTKPFGRTDVFGRRNISGFGIHYSDAIGEKLVLDTDVYFFQRTSTDNSTYGTDSKTTVGTVASSTSKDVGSELDISGKYLVSKNLTWAIGINAFIPGQYIKDNQGSDSGRVSHYGFVGAEVKF